MATNQELQSLYEDGYAAGNTWHTPVDTWEESLLIHEMGGDWRGKSVLEIGCGEGRLAALLAVSGANVWAMDYSETAIRIAKERYILPDLEFEVRDKRPLECSVDTIVMQGVLEHQDDWQAYLDRLCDNLSPGGSIITSSPSFLNLRGHVWQTLRLLFDVPMSLSDLHAINPFDMQAWCVENECDIEYRSCHHDWAHGEMMLTDYSKRLPKALADAGLDNSRVDALVDFLKRAGRWDSSYRETDWNGATVVYKITPQRD